MNLKLEQIANIKLSVQPGELAMETHDILQKVCGNEELSQVCWVAFVFLEGQNVNGEKQEIRMTLHEHISWKRLYIFMREDGLQFLEIHLSWKQETFTTELIYLSNQLPVKNDANIPGMGTYYGDN